MPTLSDFPITKKWPTAHPERIQLYSLPTPNGVKASIMLEECGLPYEVHRVDFGANDQLSPYALTGASGTYKLSKNLSVTAGVDNIFDKRLYRAGNAQGVANIAGAGAATYNEPGRTLYTSLTASF